MSAPETAAEFATRHAPLFSEVREHTFEVMRRRRLGGDWEAPENHYRNPWREAAQADAALNVSVAA